MDDDTWEFLHDWMTREAFCQTLPNSFILQIELVNYLLINTNKTFALGLFSILFVHSCTTNRYDYILKQDFGKIPKILGWKAIQGNMISSVNKQVIRNEEKQRLDNGLEMFRVEKFHWIILTILMIDYHQKHKNNLQMTLEYKRPESLSF